VTRSYRAIQLPFACLFLSLVALSPIAATPARAGIFDFLSSIGKSDDGAPTAPPADAAQAAQPQPGGDTDEQPVPQTAPQEPADSLAAAAAPVVETPAHRLYCVQYARLRSGLQIFGDAKYWWDRAKDLYARATQPAADAVMVFSGSKRIRRGHVAVVTAIVGPREIRVDHANWQNHGEIDLNMPVLDVSKDNDWSEVRVWDPSTGQFGARVYAISGFIARSLPTTSGS
jgi:CHAP domain